MEIKILGTGCAKCHKLYEEAAKAVSEAGVEATLTKVEQLDQMAAYGMVFPPGLVIDGELKSSGKIPKVSKMVQWLRESADRE